VTYLFDSSLVVPALVVEHPEHERALPWIDRVAEDEIEAVLAAHTLAEVYATLTVLPGSPRISPRMASEMMRQSLAKVQIVPLTAADYRRTVERMANMGLPGGLIYDALIACAAEKIHADGLVTFNVGHFRRVWPEGRDRIITP
jgi:predicted nucleic acid-binding protein